MQSPTYKHSHTLSHILSNILSHIPSHILLHIATNVITHTHTLTHMPSHIATNVITLRMAHRRRLTLNYSQLAYALGSVILVFLADLYVRPNEQIFYYKGTFIGYKMMFYYACIVFSFIALLSLMFWFFVERYEIDNSAINYLKKRQYNPWTKLETLTSLFYFAQVGCQYIII